jgi:hypothetical protein
MIAGATNPFAVHVGLECKSGGSAADFALTTVLAQVALIWVACRQLGALKLAEAGNVNGHGDYTDSSASLYPLIQIARVQSLLSLAPPEQLRTVFPGLDPAPIQDFQRRPRSGFWQSLKTRIGIEMRRRSYRSENPLRITPQQ